jgi:hypothetical protein
MLDKTPESRIEHRSATIATAAGIPIDGFSSQLGLAYAGRTVGPLGPEVETRRLLAAFPSTLIGTPSAVLAVFDADTNSIDEIHGTLDGLRTRGIPADFMLNDQAERYLFLVLDRIAGLHGGADCAVSIVLTVCVSNEAIFARLNEARLYLIRDEEVIEPDTSSPLDVKAMPISTGRIAIEPGDRLVLESAETAKFVPTTELVRTLKVRDGTAAPSLDEIVQRLATLASRRGGRTASLLMAQKSATGVHQDAELPNRLKVAMIAGGFFIFGVIVIFFLWHTFLRQDSKLAVVHAPIHLTVKQVTPYEAVLRWKPTRGAASYVVQIARHEHGSPHPYLVLSGTLQPGKTYIWSVRALFNNGASGAPATSSLWLRPRAARMWHVPIPLRAAVQTLLMIYNSNSLPIRVTVESTLNRHPVMAFRLAPRTRVEIGRTLPISTGKHAGLTVIANRPVFVQQVPAQFERKNITYGIPGASANTGSPGVH